MSTKLPIFYNCANCPSYCCSYPRIEVTEKDVKRLAKYLGIGAEETGRRFTTIFEDDEVRETVLRHQKDEAYGSVCRFLDLETRACTVHPARPQICRGHPGEPSCSYYTFLMSERGYQRDEDQIARAYNPPGEWVPLK